MLKFKHIYWGAVLVLTWLTCVFVGMAVVSLIRVPVFVLLGLLALGGVSLVIVILKGVESEPPS